MAVKTMRTNYLYVRDNVEIGDDLTVTDDASVGGDLTITGSLTVNGNFTFGNATTDTLLVEGLLDCNSQATFQSSVTFSSYTMHSTTQKGYFRDSGLYIYSPKDAHLSIVTDGSLFMSSGTITTGTVCLMHSSDTGCYFAVERLDGVTSKSGIKIGEYWLYVNSSNTLMLSTEQPIDDTTGHPVG